MTPSKEAIEAAIMSLPRSFPMTYTWTETMLNIAYAIDLAAHQQAMQAAQAELERIKERQPDWSPGDVVAAYADGSIVLDDGKTTWNPDRACKFLTEQLAELRAKNEILKQERQIGGNAMRICEKQRAVIDGLVEALRIVVHDSKLHGCLCEATIDRCQSALTAWFSLVKK